MIWVLIERILVKGAEQQLEEALRQIRREAIHTPGYVSGESLRDVSNPRLYVTLSTWRSREDWEMWRNSELREQFEKKIAPLLAEPEKVTVLEHA